MWNHFVKQLDELFGGDVKKGQAPPTKSEA